MRERLGFERELADLRASAEYDVAAPAAAIRAVLVLDSVKIGGGERFFDNAPDGRLLAETSKPFSPPAQSLTLTGHIEVIEGGKSRGLQATDERILKKLRVSARFATVGGVKHGTAWTAPVARDGTFAMDAKIGLDRNAWRLPFEAELTWSGGAAPRVRALIYHPALEPFLALVDSYEKKRAASQGRFAFLRSLRQVFQPDDDSSLKRLFPLILDQKPAVGPLVPQKSSEGQLLRDLTELWIAGSKVDIGHVLIGIEAHRRQGAKASGVPTAVPWGPDRVEQSVTWVGDLFGVLAYVALETAWSRGTKPPDIKYLLQKKASEQDLNGDLDGINLGAIYDQTKSVSDNVRAYYAQTPFRRFRSFARNALDQDGKLIFRLLPGARPSFDPSARFGVAAFMQYLASGYLSQNDRAKKMDGQQRVMAYKIIEPGSPQSEAVLDYFYAYLNAGLARER